MSWSASATSPSPLPPEAAAPAVAAPPTRVPSPAAGPPARARTAALVVAAVALTAGLAWWQQARQRDPHVPYGRFQLPGFDSYVYVAMAERPAVFTVAPWGYRLGVPALVHALPLRNVVRGFRIVSLGAMSAAGGLLFLFLRARGHAAWAALLGVALFALSPPAARALETPFFGEPAGVLLIGAILLATEREAGFGALALLSAVTTLAKDGVLVLALLPAVVVARWPKGVRAAAVSALAAAVPALLLPRALRWWWTPQIPVVTAPWDADLVRAAVLTLREAWAPTALAALAGGIVPLAVLGALRREARPYLRRYGLSLLMLVAVAFLAWLNVPSREPVPLFGANFERILVYAVPLLIPLALLALDALAPNLGPVPLAPGARRQHVPALAAVAVCALPFLVLDRYRRVDLQATRDGPLVLALCRESARAAARLDGGDEVTFDPASRRFAWGESDPAQLGRMRWFLRDGWGERAQYGTSEVVMHAPTATLLVPVFTPADLDLRFRVMAPSAQTLAASVNGIPLGSWPLAPGEDEQAFRVPARVLFRGDNLVTLASVDHAVGARLREVRYRRAEAR